MRGRVLTGSIEFSIKSPSLWASFQPQKKLLFLSEVRKVMKFLLDLGMNCWNSSFHAQGFESNYSSCTSRSSENICKAALEVLREKTKEGVKKTGWNFVSHKNFGAFLSEFHTPLNLRHHPFCFFQHSKHAKTKGPYSSHPLTTR